ncbi:hypothetical protein K090096B2_27500 [Bacteroides fragilis]|uniref:Uncharacterized protein n=1 Tax=Bacteroides fragilis TaxID=817 RepID=A0A5M5Q4V4_BACFG|nr:hypothetical protein F2841_00675 [Bacteroides fragilis]KAA4783671.1 hypothetical protein F3B22_00675 [Bacteroides fragilis]KAA4787864.1 hypothetical protein F3B21_15440 [Bacteroides fragilis]KAA4796399.1 hypothetical protein F2047_00675 [Bacteroides fragilis]KAA5179056.1 hypothetical protein F2Z30_14850 [Bacteroides fragilis]
MNLKNRKITKKWGRTDAFYKTNLLKNAIPGTEMFERQTVTCLPAYKHAFIQLALSSRGKAVLSSICIILRDNTRSNKTAELLYRFI